MATEQLKKDATNKALRTFVQGLGIDVAVGVALVIGVYFADKSSWGAVEWSLLSFSVFKSVVQAAGAYVMRRWLDERVTPAALLPPAPVPPPNDPPGPGVDTGEAVPGEGGHL